MPSPSTRSAKVMKKKETKEPERPPWRPSTANPSKELVTKNALLKARLLDASRRAIKASKQSAVSTQTDVIPTKLVKEVSIDVQTDMIKKRDVSILTDGTLTIKDIPTGSIFLTHSVSQMTDLIAVKDSNTQTAMPTSSVCFRKFLNNRDKTQDDVLLANELKILSQMKEIQEIDESLKSISHGNLNEEEVEYEHDFDAEISSQGNSIDGQRGHSQTPDLILNSNTAKSSRLNVPTHSAWHDIDFSDDANEELPDLPRTTISEGTAPWRDFKDIVIGRRLANMRLSPIPPRRPSLNKKQVTWSDAQQQAVSELLTEASALIDIFDRVSMLLGPDIKIKDFPTPEEIIIPPFTYDSILTKSCDILEEKLSKLRPNVRHKEIENLSPELLQYANYDGHKVH